MHCDMHKEEKNPHISEVQECNLLLAIDTVTSQQNIPISEEEAYPLALSQTNLTTTFNQNEIWGLTQT